MAAPRVGLSGIGARAAQGALGLTRPGPGASFCSALFVGLVRSSSPRRCSKKRTHCQLWGAKGSGGNGRFYDTES